jgi:transposase
MERDITELARKVWKWLGPQLPERPPAPKGGRPWVDDEKCLLGIVWVLKTGARWKDIPKELGVSYSSCWRRHVEWSGQGLFQAAWAAALAEAEKQRPTAGREQVVDGMFVRAKKGARTLATPSGARG